MKLKLLQQLKVIREKTREKIDLIMTPNSDELLSLSSIRHSPKTSKWNVKCIHMNLASKLLFWPFIIATLSPFSEKKKRYIALQNLTWTFLKLYYDSSRQNAWNNEQLSFLRKLQKQQPKSNYNFISITFTYATPTN